MSSESEHDGRWWRLEGEGRILLWDATDTRWEPWSPTPSGPRPPPQFLDPEQRQVETDKRRRGASATVAAAGALAVVGSMMPWITFSGLGSFSRSGLDAGGDGIYTLLAGVGLLLIGLAEFGNFSVPPKILRTFPLLGAVIIGAITVIDYADINYRVDSFNDGAGGFGVAAVGAGIWLLFVAAALAAVGGMTLRSVNS